MDEKQQAQAHFQEQQQQQQLYPPPAGAPIWGVPQQQAQGFFQQTPPQQALQQNVMYVYAPHGSYALPGTSGIFAIPGGQPVYYPNQTVPQAMVAPNATSPFANVTTPQCSSTRNMAVAALVTHCVGLFFFLPHLASIIISLHMVNKGYIVRRKAAVIAFSVLELVGYAFVLTFSWFGEVDCYNSYYTSGGSYSYTCYYFWLGWISLVVWFAFAVAFGIPRVVYTWTAEGKRNAPVVLMPVVGAPTTSAYVMN